MSTRPTIGITMGDPAGIGPEICLRLLNEPSVLALCCPVVFGDGDILRRVAQEAGLSLGIHATSLAQWNQLGPVEEAMVIDCGGPESADIQPGVLSAACGQSAFRSIQSAIEAALSRRIAGVVTAPIHKRSLRLAQIPFPGHTEIFAALTRAERACMMLASDALTVSMVTTHIGYAEVPQRLSTERVVQVIELTAEAVGRLKSREPRLAICGLNPHAGENGLFGAGEEERFLVPALEIAHARGIHIEGPFPPDTVFVPQKRSAFDAIVCLYHDQGHIPFKMLAFETGVNITLGLPIIRTSVDHGTAFDIAWKGQASPVSLFEAVRMAVRLAAGRSQPRGQP